jgi:hypothetical protein
MKCLSSIEQIAQGSAFVGPSMKQIANRINGSSQAAEDGFAHRCGDFRLPHPGTNRAQQFKADEQALRPELVRREPRAI